jgi:hypothetical protein
VTTIGIDAAGDANLFSLGHVWLFVCGDTEKSNHNVNHAPIFDWYRRKAVTTARRIIAKFGVTPL